MVIGSRVSRVEYLRKQYSILISERAFSLFYFSL